MKGGGWKTWRWICVQDAAAGSEGQRHRPLRQDLRPSLFSLPK